MRTNYSRHFAFRVAGVLLACFQISASIAAETAGCEILSAAQVGAIVGNPMKGGATRRSRDGDRVKHCSFAGGDIRVEMSVQRADSEQKAARSYENALEQSHGASRDEPLHGVGIESRYRTTEKGSEIVARFGVHVVVVTTNAGREPVVGLVRAIGAKVTAQR